MLKPLDSALPFVGFSLITKEFHMPDSMTQSAAIPCSIFLHAIPADDQNVCICGEIICESCPAFGCLCVDDDPTIRARRAELRAGAIELGRLRAQHEFMGADSLTTGQQSRLVLLSDVVDSLRTEVNRLDEIRCGEDHSEDAA